MPHNFPIPDEASLEKLVMSVYERMPVAEISRLNRIEERLVRKLALQQPSGHANKIPWWIVLLLAGSFAAAAWWAGDIYNAVTNGDDNITNRQDTVLQQRETPVHPDADPENQPAIQENQDVNKQSPVIYQREH